MSTKHHIKLFGSLAAQHDFVCHDGDGSRCTDGCDAPADPKRLAMLDQIAILDQMSTKHAHIKTRDCAFEMLRLPVNQCWATQRVDRDGTAWGLELHATRGEAVARLNERVDFQRAVEGTTHE